MQSYIITGPESLIRAAKDEAASTGLTCGTQAERKTDALFLHPESKSYWETDAKGPFCSEPIELTLPADWDKFMGILAELKKPKLPEYVRLNCDGHVYKVKELDAEKGTLLGVNPYGKEVNGHFFYANKFTPITEQEFIDGGLRELAEAGYVKGAGFRHNDGEEYILDRVEYQSNKSHPHSGSTYSEYQEKGFCFSICDKDYIRVAVGKCTLVPTLPTTIGGIPYTIYNGEASIGPIGEMTTIRCSTLKHLLRNGVTELVTKAGRLTHADLELLTK